MTASRNSSLKVFFLCGFLCLMSAVSAQTARDSRILSPCPGTWANMQSLVVQAESGCDVYYSVTDVNPLAFGIAYDGPVLLDQTGNCSVAVTIVDPDGTTSTSIISYMVKPDTCPVPALRNNGSPVYPIKRGDSISIPSDLFWTVSSSSFNGNASETATLEKHCGGKIMLEGAVSSDYYAELVLSSDKSHFRYIVKVCALADTSLTEAPAPAVSDIEFSQWNWIRFYQGEAVLYSIDGDPWCQTTRPVYLDRQTDHTVSWKRVSPVTSRTAVAEPEEGHTLFIPAKPALSGLPPKGFSQNAVQVTAPGSDYLLQYTGDNGRICWSDTWYADVLSGDARGFSQTFTVYYRGIKQGTVHGSFIIDKSAPAKPVMKASCEVSFSRKPVYLQMDSDSAVYAKVSAVSRFAAGCTVNDYYNLLPSIADLQNVEEELLSLIGSAPEPVDLMRCGYYRSDEDLLLEPDENGAVFYLVSALARDTAGNISGLSFYHVVIDDANYYIAPASASHDSAVPRGFPDNPYQTVQEALNASSIRQNPRLYITGMVSSSDDILVNRPCTISGIGGGGVRFTRNSVVSLLNASVKLENLRFEKKLADKKGGVTQSNLMLAENATITLKECDIVANLGDSGTAFLTTNSRVTLENSLLTLQTATYGCGISSESSDVTLINCQLFVSGKTCSGVTQFRNACRLERTDMQLTGSLVQAVSLSDAYGDFSDCTFTDTLRSSSSWALWAGGDSAYSLSGCKAAGFKALIAD